jgi:hypothetical protein
MLDRDPRTDPRPGDCFRKGDGFTTIVTAFGGTLAFNFCGKLADAPPMLPWHEPWLPAFRKWAAE